MATRLEMTSALGTDLTIALAIVAVPVVIGAYVWLKNEWNSQGESGLERLFEPIERLLLGQPALPRARLLVGLYAICFAFIVVGVTVVSLSVLLHSMPAQSRLSIAVQLFDTHPTIGGIAVFFASVMGTEAGGWLPVVYCGFPGVMLIMLAMGLLLRFNRARQAAVGLAATMTLTGIMFLTTGLFSSWLLTRQLHWPVRETVELVMTFTGAWASVGWYLSRLKVRACFEKPVKHNAESHSAHSL